MKETLLWAVVFVAIAIVIATGIRIVDWLTEGNTVGIWKIAFALVASAGAGGKAISVLRRNGDDA